MPNWNQIVNELRNTPSPTDAIRRRYLRQLNKLTGRNTIIYYSGWLQNAINEPNIRASLSINDADMNGFMTAIHKLDRTKGLDLILHTPGGEVAATEAIINYLRKMFGTDIRAIIPQIAMSGGTMIACACKEIVMGKQSSLGPVDPLVAGIPAGGIIEEFQQAMHGVITDPRTKPIWQQVIGRYPQAIFSEAIKAIEWSTELVETWLSTGMFPAPADKALVKTIVQEIANFPRKHLHTRHFSIDKAKSLGLKIIDLEADDKFQDAVLSVHHACMRAIETATTLKMIENHKGKAYILSIPRERH